MTDAIQRVIAVLKKHDELDVRDISRLAFVGLTTLNNGYLRCMREAGLIHVSGWVIGKGPRKPLYRIGAGVTPERPKPKEGKVKTREWRERCAQQV